MARNFNGSEYGTIASALVTAPPFSMCAWIRPTVITPPNSPNPNGYNQILGVGHVGGYADGFFLRLVNCDIMASARAGGQTDLYSGSTRRPQIGQWQFVYGAWIDSSHRYAGIDTWPYGTPAAGTTLVPTGLGQTRMGARDDGLSYFFTGDIAHPAIYDAVLPPAAYLALALGTSPLSVEPDHLIEYWPLGNNSHSGDGVVHGNDWTWTGGRYVVDPEIYQEVTMRALAS